MSINISHSHSLNGLSKSHKTQAERELNLIISQVREELKSTTAPPTNRMASYTGLSQQVVSTTVCMHQVHQ